MRPEIFRIPWLDLPIHSYGLLIVAGFLLASFLAHREARRRGLPDFVYDFGIAMLLTGILGGRLWYYIENYSTEFAGRGLFAFVEIWKGGLVFYGGAIGGMLGGLAFLRWKRLPVADCLDSIAPFVLVGMAFGRLGCWMNGCCYGKVCPPNFPIAAVFPKINNPANPAVPSPAFAGQLASGQVLEGDAAALSVYPTQLFEAAYDFLLAGALWWYLRGRAPRGIGFPLAFVLYGAGRFALEILRGDNPPFFLGLTISQTLSVALIPIFGLLCIFLYTKDLRERAQSLQKNFEKPLTGRPRNV